MMFMSSKSDVYRQLKTVVLLFNRENYVYGRPKMMFINSESDVYRQLKWCSWTVKVIYIWNTKIFMNKKPGGGRGGGGEEVEDP